MVRSRAILMGLCAALLAPAQVRAADEWTDFPICTASGNQSYPSIWGDVVVWEDTRNGNPDIYGARYNAQTGGWDEFPICTLPTIQRLPSIHGDWVVWMDHRNESNYSPKGDVYGLNLATGVEYAISTSPRQQAAPRIWNNTVVWHDHRSGGVDIWGATYDPATDSWNEFFIADSGRSDEWPVISGDLVTWFTNSWEIYYTRLGDGIPVRIPGAVGTYPQVYGDVIVWTQTAGPWNYSGYDVRAYDTATQQEIRVTDDGGQTMQWTRSIFGSTVAFADSTYHATTQRDIWLADVRTLERSPILLLPGDQDFPRLYGDTVVFMDRRSGNWDIYGARAANTPPIAVAGGPYETTATQVLADVDPDTLNINSNGKWVTAYLTTADAGGTAVVDLNGNGSSDPDGDALTYDWTILDDEGNVVIELPDAGPAPSVELAPGEYAAMLIVNDGKVDCAEPSFAAIDVYLVNLAAVDPTAVTLNGVPAAWGEMQDAETLMVKFDRAAFAATLIPEQMNLVEIGGAVTGSDTIMVIDRGGNGKAKGKGKR